MEKETSLESKESIKRTYAEFINSGEFRVVTEKEGDFSIFELTLLTRDTATFKVSPNKEKLVIERPNYLAGCKKDIESGGKHLITKKVGTAHKSGAIWIIDSPLDVQITKEKENNKVEYNLNKNNEKMQENANNINNFPDRIYFKTKNGTSLSGESKNKIDNHFVIYNIRNNKEADVSYIGGMVNLDYLDPVTEFVNNPDSINYTKIETSTPGRAELINNQWVITIKPKIKFIDERDTNTEKQKKINEIYSEIMEMINRNNESLLIEKNLEEELAQLIASNRKKVK